MRFRRVINRGEPGVRRKPRSRRAFASWSSVTPFGDVVIMSRTTSINSSCGAVCTGPPSSSATAGLGAGGGGAWWRGAIGACWPDERESL